MALQSKTIAVGNLQDDTSGNNYAVNKAVYILKLDKSLQPIFLDYEGEIPITQDGVNNVTDQYGEFTFFVEAGDYIARVGGRESKITVTGADYFNNRIEETENAIIEAIAGRGVYYPVGSFEDGFTYTDINQVGTLGDNPNQTYYVYTGGLANLPHVVPAITDPAASGLYKQVNLNSLDSENVIYKSTNAKSVLDTLTGTTTSRITNAGIGFANWPQGKGVVNGNRIMFGYNHGAGHGGSTLHAYSTDTLDGTQWSAPKLIAEPRDDGGTILEATAWGMVERSGVIYAAVRFRQGGDTGTLIQSIYKYEAGSWSFEVDLTFQTAEGLTPVLLHDGVLTDDNRIAFGYHDSAGSLGVLIIDPDDNYSTEEIVLLTAANNNVSGSILQAELSFLKRSDNGNILIVSRTQNVGVQKPLSWVYNGNFTAVVQNETETPFNINVNPVSMVFSADSTKVMFFYSNRYNTYNSGVERAALYMAELSLTEAYSLDFTSLIETKLINLSGTTTAVAASAGVQKAVKKGDQIYVAVASKSRDNDDGSDVYCLTLDFEDDSFLGLNLDSLQASQNDSLAEIKLNKVANYQARIRMNGKSVLSRDLNKELLEIGSYTDPFSIGIYNDMDGATTPAMFFNVYSDNWLGMRGTIDINRHIRHTSAGVSYQAGVNWRMRVGTTPNNLGGSFIYHDNSGGTDVVEIGNAQGFFSVAVYAQPSTPLMFKSAATTDDVTITFDSGGNTANARFRTDGLECDFTVRPLRDLLANLPSPSSALRWGSMAYATDALKQGETTGNGTGVPVYYSNGNWYRMSDDTIAST